MVGKGQFVGLDWNRIARLHKPEVKTDNLSRYFSLFFIIFQFRRKIVF